MNTPYNSQKTDMQPTGVQKQFHKMYFLNIKDKYKKEYTSKQVTNIKLHTLYISCVSEILFKNQLVKSKQKVAKPTPRPCPWPWVYRLNKHETKEYDIIRKI